VETKRPQISVRVARNPETRALLAAASVVERAILLMFLYLGLRKEELIHLRTGIDINLEQGKVRVQKRGPDPLCSCKACQGKGWSPKNGSRVVEIPESLRDLMQALHEYTKEHPPEANVFFFRNPNTGRVWNGKALETWFKSLCRRAEVVYGRKATAVSGDCGITLHTLRHTCATNLIRNGVRESVVAGIIGDTIETVVRTYVHLDSTDLGRGVEQGPRYG
jgi:integrase